MKETIENNKLIAEFMGAELEHGEYDMIPVLGFLTQEPDEKHFYTTKEMQYHSSWDWLMPVVEKIMDEGYQFSFGSSRLGYRVGKNTWLADGDLSKGRLTATFEATVFMIKNILKNETNKTKIRSAV